MQSELRTDEYLTLQAPSEGQYKEKGSRFIGIAIPVTTVEEAHAHLERLRKNYHDARHHCYAYRIGEAPHEVRYNDDGEPSGTAGKPIFGQIQSFGLTNILVVVIRYFGGIKLGTGGLIQAYKTASMDALQNGLVLTRTWMVRLHIDFKYEQMNRIMHILKEEGAHLTSQEFNLDCSIGLEIRKGKAEEMAKKLMDIESVRCRVI